VHTLGTGWEQAGPTLALVAGGALATRRNLAGIRQFSATVAGGWLSLKEPVAGKRQVAGG